MCERRTIPVALYSTRQKVYKKAHHLSNKLFSTSYSSAQCSAQSHPYQVLLVSRSQTTSSPTDDVRLGRSALATRDQAAVHLPPFPTCSAAASLLSSWMTVARASGFTPASQSWIHIRKVSSSNPVLSSFDISFTTTWSKRIRRGCFIQCL